MPVWAIADLHLSFGVPDKHMKIFGPQWEAYTEKIEASWRHEIAKDDLVLIAGDISWAMRSEEAQPDLDWIGRLPGEKVLIKGNHDYWCESKTKVQRLLPASCHYIQNDSFAWKGISVAGARLWDTPAYEFNAYINYQDNPKAKNPTATDQTEDNQRIFDREIGRLETSLKSMNPQARARLAMTHYPPIGADLKESVVSRLLEKYQIDCCVFGHLHNVKRETPMFGERHGVRYYLTSCDYLDFKPICILP